MPILTKKITPDLEILLDELKQQCLCTGKLIQQLENKNLTSNQFDAIMGELMAQVVHLRSHCEMAEDEWLR